MGRREKKTGKGRLDKYYKLAKEQGYRARSAFKLIQLDKKYEILKNARCLIDLCAAPGGWLQVATKYMPPNSIILGVDLVPIKPIPRVITFAEDITTDACRKRIRDNIKDWKADVVLHDGAPNVGTAWAQDAFTQSELVLSSLKLAVDFLAPGGCFVTKVFRSKDYNSLLWVFNQLFKKVEATKPPSSRNVSAEIFVVCTGYLAPKRIDPRLLNPTHVFKDLDMLDAPRTENADANAKAGSLPLDKLTPAAFSVFHPDKKRRAREGYDDGDLILFKRTPISTFVRAADPIAVLGASNQLDFDATDEDRQLRAFEETTDSITASATDLKVLGKKDFKMLLRWRMLARKHLNLDAETLEAKTANDGDEPDVSITPLTTDEQMALDIERLETEETARERRDRRRSNEKKARELQRMQLQMTTPMDIGLEAGQAGVGDQGDDFMFDMNEMEAKAGGKRIRAELDGNEADDLSSASEDEVPASRQASKRVPLERIRADHADADSDEDENRLRDLEATLDDLYDEYQNHKLAKDAKHRVREARMKRTVAEGGEWTGIRDRTQMVGDHVDAEQDIDANEAEEDSEEEAAANTLAYHNFIPDAIPLDEMMSDDDEEDINDIVPESNNRSTSNDLESARTVPHSEMKKQMISNRATAMWFDQPIFKDVPGLDKVLSAPISQPFAANEKETSTTFTTAREGQTPDSGKRKRKHQQSDPNTWDDEEEIEITKEEENAATIAKHGLTTAEAMTIAGQLVNREKTTTQLIDDGFNKRMLANDKEGLPTWFLDDEMRHFRHNIPVTKEAVDAIRAKMRALNARPIKKIAEAKARKKMRTLRRMAKMQKKADVLNEAGDLTERDKAAQIQALMAKAGKEPKKKKSEVKLVIAKGASKGLKGRPNGVKGRYKMVDSRGKKELRALKRIEKRDGPKRKR